MRIGTGISLARPMLGHNGGPSFSPLDLGTDLYAWWSARTSEHMTLGGGNAVSTFYDVTDTYQIAQATSSQQPIYSAGWLEFDGIDDILFAASLFNFPLGSTPVEVWGRCRYDGAGSVSGAKGLFGYGTNQPGQRQFVRLPASGVNRYGVGVGNGSVRTYVQNNNINFSGNHITRGRVGATSTIPEIDSNTPAATNIIPATGSSPGSVAMGGLLDAGGNVYWAGAIRDIVVTKPLSGDVVTNMYNFLGS